MAKCKHETSNGRCGLKDCYAYRHKCYTEEFCKCHRPQTNADRIRAMNDEELAAFLNKIVVNHHIKNADNCNHCLLKDARPCDTEGIVDWLKQPAK